MTVFFTPHAVERAKERYGIELSAHDMAEILRATKDGRAQKMASWGVEGERSRVFIMTFMGRGLIFALRPDADFIMTFLPADYFLKASRVDHQRGTGKMKAGARRKARTGNTYRRDKSNRNTFTDELGD